MGMKLLKKVSLKLPEASTAFEILLWFVFLGAIMVKCFYFQFSTRLNIKPFFTPINDNMLLATFTSVLLFIVFIFLFFNRKRLIALLCIDILLSLLLFSDTIYYRYYYNAITVPVLYQLGLVGSLKESIKSLLRTKDLIFVIDLPIIITVMALFKRTFHLKVVKLNVVKRLVTAVVIFAMSFGLFQLAYGKSSPGAFPYDNNYVTNSLGVFYFHYYDIKKFAKEHFLTDSKLTEKDRSDIEEFL